MAQALGTDWDTKAGSPPDVWVPDSTAWVRRASTAAIAERMMPDLQPMLARHPVGPGDAEADGGGPRLARRRAVLAGRHQQGRRRPAGLGEVRQGRLGPVQVRDERPAAVHRRAARAHGDPGRQRRRRGHRRGAGDPRQAQAGTRRLHRHHLAAARRPRQGRRPGPGKALQYISAFPALEQDVLAYNKTNPKVPLVAVYPSNGSADADNPYLILDAPWAEKDKQDVARQFLALPARPRRAQGVPRRRVPRPEPRRGRPPSPATPRSAPRSRRCRGRCCCPSR